MMLDIPEDDSANGNTEPQSAVPEESNLPDEAKEEMQSSQKSLSQAEQCDLAFFSEYLTSPGVVLFLSKHFNLSFQMVKLSL